MCVRSDMPLLTSIACTRAFFCYWRVRDTGIRPLTLRPSSSHRCSIGFESGYLGNSRTLLLCSILHEAAAECHEAATEWHEAAAEWHEAATEWHVAAAEWHVAATEWHEEPSCINCMLLFRWIWRMATGVSVLFWYRAAFRLLFTTTALVLVLSDTPAQNYYWSSPEVVVLNYVIVMETVPALPITH